MKQVLYFEIVDMGLQPGMGTPIARMREAATRGLYNGYTAGCGTDAESALEDMLNMMQEDDFDITGLEGQIKDGWRPSMDEGDGRDVWYHFGIVYKFNEVSLAWW